MQDRVPPCPTTRNKTASRTHCACFCFMVYFYVLVEAESQLHAVLWRSHESETCQGRSLQQFHFAHWWLSRVLCDCNWLESLKLARACQPLKALKSPELIQLSSPPKPNRLLGEEPPPSGGRPVPRLCPSGTFPSLWSSPVLDDGFVWSPFFSITEASFGMNRLWPD